ncbi:MAG: hypothetical protein JXA42_09885 [Anaerolineales bacterium]|nr:hypothetical protein [Anaerolineales bacterium]
MNSNKSLPLERNLTLITIVSFIILILMAAASIAGILYPAAIYPTDDLLQSFMPTDVTVICIGLPALLASIWLSRRGKLIGLLLWPGVLFYVFYNYLPYIFAMPLNMAFLLHLALVGLSGYALIGLTAGIDGKSVQQRLAGIVPERLSGGILAGLGFLFFLRAVLVLANAIISTIPMAETELAVNVSDLMTTPAWVFGGVLLWRRQTLGYVTGLGLLFQASLLFIGLIVFLLVQPILTEAAFSPVDIVVVFIMGLVCFIPFVFYARGVVSS